MFVNYCIISFSFLDEIVECWFVESIWGESKNKDKSMFGENIFLLKFILQFLFIYFVHFRIKMAAYLQLRCKICSVLVLSILGVLMLITQCVQTVAIGSTWMATSHSGRKSTFPLYIQTCTEILAKTNISDFFLIYILTDFVKVYIVYVCFFLSLSL